LREFHEKKHVMQPLFSSAIRSRNGTETFDSHSYNYMLTEHGISPRSYNNHGTDPIQDNHCASDGDEEEGGENSPPLTESNQIAKDIADKHVESPSNP
jgi:phospholipase C